MSSTPYGIESDLVTRLLPVLGRSLDLGFNVFDVMHHGLHEKQVSNVFSWLLDVEGTHWLGSRFAALFVDEVNLRLGDRGDLPADGYAVLQEVNTSDPGESPDIADIVLESSAACLVVENYFASDGHGHNYWAYLRHSQRDGRRGEVVLLCRDEDASLQTLGWENAPVVTYARLMERLLAELRSDLDYQRKHPEAYSFVDQMHRKFVEGKGRMDEQDVLGFVIAMCDTGEARRYQAQNHEMAADQFANDLAEQARHRLGEGRELLHRAKTRLRNFSGSVLTEQLEGTFGSGFVQNVNARYSGIYQWTINFTLDEEGMPFGEALLQIKFGPSAWFSNEQDSGWMQTVAPDEADYSKLFITRAKKSEIRQSSVTLQEVLDGLDPSDRRLHDEIVAILKD